jgi:tRNA1(Val) A37 N6-methylase TrmN6
VQGVTNTNATSASTSTKATSALVMAATNAGSEYEISVPFILHAEITAYTSGTFSATVQG